MRLRKLIAPVIVIGFLLFITGSYVAHLERMELLSTRGGWTVEVEGSVYLSRGVIYSTIDRFVVQYDSTPELSSYGDYLGDMFSSPPNDSMEVAPNQTLVEVHVLITSEGDGLAKRTLLDKIIDVAYVWAGGDFDSDGRIAVFSYELGPYVAYHEYSPYKIVCEVTADMDVERQTKYLTIPNIMEGSI
jgi:hypothetical protein